MGICFLVRHGESIYNVEKRINGDPTVPVALTDRGREEAAQLNVQLAHIQIDVCVHTRFCRTIETARLGLGERAGEVPFVCDPLLDDIHAGELEGQPISAFAAWTDAHGPAEPLPGGESLREAAARFAQGFRNLAARPERVVLAVCHELPIRLALNAAAGGGDLQRPHHDIANAAPYVFERSRLESAARQIEASLGDASGVGK